MRTHLVLATLLALAPLSNAFAHDEGPCKKIVEKCEAAGFKKGAHKATGKGAYVDCLDKILKGETVAGVSAAPDEVSACQAVKAKHHKK